MHGERIAALKIATLEFVASRCRKIVMFANVSRLFVFVLLICVESATAQVQPIEPKAAEPAIADVVKWVRRDGTEAVMSHDVARMFGWGEADVVVIRMALTNPDSKASYAFDVVRDRPNIVMIARSPGEMTIWQLSGSGELLQTLHATSAGVAPADNAVYLPKWRETLAVFFQLVPPPPAGSNQ
jgi:hypothetical protein